MGFQHGSIKPGDSLAESWGIIIHIIQKILTTLKTHGFSVGSLHFGMIAIKKNANTSYLGYLEHHFWNIVIVTLRYIR